MICNRVVDYMNQRKTNYITEADVESIKNDMISGANFIDVDKFDNLISSGDTSKEAIKKDDILEVLHAIAMNSMTSPCNASRITCETSSSIESILDDLVSRDVLERTRNNYYRIKVGLFAEWLRLRGR